jgi:hypothetical protein
MFNVGRNVTVSLSPQALALFAAILLPRRLEHARPTVSATETWPHQEHELRRHREFAEEHRPPVQLPPTCQIDSLLQRAPADHHALAHPQGVALTLQALDVHTRNTQFLTQAARGPMQLLAEQFDFKGFWGQSFIVGINSHGQPLSRLWDNL